MIKMKTKPSTNITRKFSQQIISIFASCIVMMSLPAVCHADTTIAVDKRLTQFNASNGQVFSYQEFIDHFKVPSLSFAVVDNYEIVHSQQLGRKDHTLGALADNQVNENTAFSTASIAKPVTATIVAMLAEQKKLDLDEPVSKYLKRWQLPASEFTKTRPITFRDLLTHTAGTSQGGFADFQLGDDLPTLIDSLNGVKVPRYNSPISVMFTPGSDWEYSGGGYVILQVAIEDITGKSLAELAQKMLFEPLGMNNSTMYQHGQPQFLTNVAKAHNVDLSISADGIVICPQVAPSGLWSTPNDMALFMIDVQRALNGHNSKVISKWVAKQTTKVHTLAKVGGWAAGWMRAHANGNIDWFSHGGSNTGTGGQVMSSMQDGKGIMVFINASTPTRNPATEALIDNIIGQMGWAQEHSSVAAQIPSTITDALVGRYLSPFNQIVEIEQIDEQLIYSNPLAMGGSSFTGPLHYQGDKKFALNEHANLISIETNPKDKAQYLTFSRANTDLKDFNMRKLTASERLPFEVAATGTAEQTKQAYISWQMAYPQSALLSRYAMNDAGYLKIAKGKLKAARNIFVAYTHLHPNDSNAFDSLAEAYMLMGNKTLAILNYEKSLELDSKNLNAKAMINKIRNDM